MLAQFLPIPCGALVAHDNRDLLLGLRHGERWDRLEAIGEGGAHRTDTYFPIFEAEGDGIALLQLQRAPNIGREGDLALARNHSEMCSDPVDLMLRSTSTPG